MTKGMNNVFTTMDDMGQDLHNMGKYMEYYAAKLHQVDKHVEVSKMFFLFDHKLFTLTQLKMCKHDFYASSYSDNTLLYAR